MNFKVGETVVCIKDCIKDNSTGLVVPINEQIKKGEEKIITKIYYRYLIFENPMCSYKPSNFRKKTSALSMTFVTKEELKKQREELILLN